VNSLNTEWLLAAKVDYNINGDHRIFFRYNTDHGVQATGTDAINPAFNANSVQPAYGGQFGWTGSFGPRVINQLTVAASYYSAIFGPPDIKAALATFPTTFVFFDGAPFTNLGGGGNQGSGDQVYPQGRKVRQNQVVDDVALIAGTQTVKFGMNLRKNWVSTYTAFPNTSGTMTFNSMQDFVDGSLGNGSTYSQSFVQIGAVPLKMYSVGFYGQDEWKIRPNLTWTVAIRFDRNSNITCSNHCFNEFNSPFSPMVHDVNTPYNAIISGKNQAFPSLEPIIGTPRTGFAWGATKSTVIRGGIGIFSDLYQGVIADRFVSNSPAKATFSTSSGLIAPGNARSAFANVANSAAAFQNGFASGATLTQLQKAVTGFSVPTFDTVAAGFNSPKYYEWNFEVQQGIGNSASFSINYVGNKGIDETLQNAFQNGYAPKGFSGLPTSAPDPRFGQIRELYDTGYSHYNGLVSSLKWRLNSQFTGSLAYTFSHSKDTCSNACLEPFNALTAVSLRYQVSPDLKLNYGDSDYDVRHSFNANYVWTPKVPFKNAFARGALGGWTVAGTVLFHSGYPFSMLNSGVRSAAGIVNLNGLATNSFLADWVGGTTDFPSCTTPNISCYTKSQFATSANQKDFGNIPRNSFRGPGYFDTDMNVNKTFAVKERYKLLVGMYFFNLMNHPNFDLPGNNLAAGNFGQILGTVPPPSSAYGSFQGSAVSGRVIQTQVKFTF